MDRKKSSNAYLLKSKRMLKYIYKYMKVSCILGIIYRKGEYFMEEIEDSKSYKKLLNRGRSKYLIARIIVYFLFLLITISGLYDDKNITDTMYFNTLFLFSLPLVIEYYFEFDVYTDAANASRIMGLVFSGIMAFMSVIGLMGQFKIEINSEYGIQRILYLQTDIMWVFKILPWICLVFILGDWVFCFGKKEIIFLGLQDVMKDSIKQAIRDNKGSLMLKEKQKFEEKGNAAIADMLAKK